MGSPPQVRGILWLNRKLEEKKGITPAGAGHTLKHRSLRLRTWDHPRRCGAYTTSSKSDSL